MADPTVTFYPSGSALPEHAFVVDNTVDVLAEGEALRQHSSLVLQFPKWTDGRAYSQAALLRGRVQFKGELIASGEVLVDMLPLLRRCGIDAVQLLAGQREDAAQRALTAIGTPYQRVLSERRTAAAQA